MSRPILLSISVLISNRPDTVRKCLDSIKPLLEQVPSELILVDTGCGETVRKIIGEYTNQIISFGWCRDFSKARNAGLKKAKGKWFLYLDDDEWFEDVSDIIRFFNSGEYMAYGVGLYIQRNYLVSDGSEYTELVVARMVRLEPDIEFIHKVHECFNRAPGMQKQLDAYVHHYGYIYQSAEAHEAHAMRNISLLQEELEEHPRSMRGALQLAQEYNSIGDTAKSLELSEESIAKAGEGPVEDDYCLPPLCANEVNCYIRLERYGEAIASGERHLKNRWPDKMARAMIEGMLAVACMEQEAYGKCMEHAGHYWDAWQDYQKNREEYMEYSLPVTNTCFHDMRRALFLSSGVRAAIRLGKDVLAWQWFQGIGWDSPRDYVDPRMVRDILKRLQTAEGEERKPYKEMRSILLSHREWADFVLKEMAENGMEPETFPERIRLLAWRAMDGLRSAAVSAAALEETQEDRVSAVALEGARNDRTDGSGKDIGTDADSIFEGLKDYARYKIEMCEAIYRAEIIDTMPDILSAEERGAYAVRDLLECTKVKRYAEAVKLVREIKDLLPGLANIMKQYLKWLEKQMERQKEESQQAEGEFQVLARQIKTKVYAMMEAGQYQAALAVVEQLQVLMPEDKEILQMKEKISKKR